MGPGRSARCGDIARAGVQPSPECWLWVIPSLAGGIGRRSAAAIDSRVRIDETGPIPHPIRDTALPGRRSQYKRRLKTADPAAHEIAAMAVRSDSISTAGTLYGGYFGAGIGILLLAGV